MWSALTLLLIAQTGLLLIMGAAVEALGTAALALVCWGLDYRADRSMSPDDH